MKHPIGTAQGFIAELLVPPNGGIYIDLVPEVGEESYTAQVRSNTVIRNYKDRPVTVSQQSLLNE